MGKVRNFGFGNILSTFFFERVPALSPIVDIVPHGVRDPAQRRWENVMRRLGRGRVANPYPMDFFPWWRRQIIVIDDYPYATIDFCGDTNMPLPQGAAYGNIGNKSQTHFKIFELLIFFVFFDILTQKTCFGVTTHNDNLSCVCRCWTMATGWFPSS